MWFGGPHNALIGHTGFVGSNLARQIPFSHLYNSSNFQEMRDQRFDAIVCAGVSAVKWKANLEPEADWSGISALIDELSTVTAEYFVLISTVDVYPDPALALDEDAVPPPDNHAYGLHRLRLEEFVATKFSHHSIVRLPALFGPGLKKNVIFDLINNNQVERINPRGLFQWYPLHRLPKDLETIHRRGLGLVNLVTEPVSTRAILDDWFPGRSVDEAATTTPSYAIRTKYAELLGGRDGYVMDAPDVLTALGDFLHER
jgi:hypothetical protein